MSQVKLTDALFSKLAGWEAVKQARSMVSTGRVISSDWQPPLLKGVVAQEGTGALRAGLLIQSDSDAENLCPCRDSRERGIICAHSVAIGLHFIKSQTAQPPASAKAESRTIQSNPIAKVSSKILRRSVAGEEGETLEISVILPPNLTDALSKNKVMVYLEGKWRKGRIPLNALPFNVPFTLSPQDEALLTSLESLNNGDTPAMLIISASQLTDQLSNWIGHPRVSLGKSVAVEVSDEFIRLKVSALLEASGEILLRWIHPPGHPASLESVIHGKESWFIKANRFLRVGLPPGLENLVTGPLRISRARVPTFLNLDWPKLMATCDVETDFSLEDFTLDVAMPAFKLQLAGGLAMLEAKLEVFYDGKPVGVMSNEGHWLADAQSPTRYYTRDFQGEQVAISRLLHQGFVGPDARGLYQLKGQNFVLNFFAREFMRLEKEWNVTLEERLERSTRQNLERIEPRFQITPSGEQWFDLHVDYNTAGGDRFSPSDIQRLLLSGQSHTRLKNGKFAVLDTGAVEELQEVLLDCAPTQQDDGYRLQSKQSAFLDSTLARQPGWQVQAPLSWKQRAAQQRGEVKLSAPPLGELESVLRSYQREGVAWLHFLRTNGFGGVLADEMGLGKTLQVLALLDSLRRNQHSPPLAPALVVCPTSLVFNWALEAAKFTPMLRVLPLQGTGRHEQFSMIAEQDLVITSYALLRRDAELYRNIEFDLVVLDEAQHIKNRQTQNAQAVKALRSRHRLVLTGTPLENSVLDLWSIFDFLMPGYLGNAQDFRERYEQPITRDKSLETQDRLARRLRPFLLRRLKREVATDLPERIEQVSFCELNSDQYAVYQQILNTSRQEIVNAVQANGLPKSRMVVLTALLRLRQVCCDLRLLPLAPTSNPSEAEPALGSGKLKDIAFTPAPGKDRAKTILAPSGKVELFNELLEEVLDGDHRVLVFSQFTSMLGLLSEELSAQDIKFSYLDGETKNRQQVIETFQRDASIPVFLISLKAGGVGLNLTGADTVFHFDPWWNPAVEAQATDRAHRIGQKRIVTSYKFITRGTVEEKILNLQARKKALIGSMLGGEEEIAKALDWQEIQDLLSE